MWYFFYFMGEGSGLLYGMHFWPFSIFYKVKWKMLGILYGEGVKMKKIWLCYGEDNAKNVYGDLDHDKNVYGGPYSNIFLFKAEIKVALRHYTVTQWTSLPWFYFMLMSIRYLFKQYIVYIFIYIVPETSLW